MIWIMLMKDDHKEMVSVAIQVYLFWIIAIGR